MGKKQGFFVLKGSVQHYDWGGKDFIPGMIGLNNQENLPVAEYWMGSHPKAPSLIQVNGKWEDIRQLTDLPFLLKIMDVQEMLSIQVHPERSAAEKAFREENQKGIPLDAGHRNYRDPNHKPELICALTEFWLLHGFMSLESIRDTIERTPEFSLLLPHAAMSIAQLYHHIMYMDKAELAHILGPLRSRLDQSSGLIKDQPDYWARKAFEKFGLSDPGIFSIYFFNLVKLKKNESIFQAAGIPHAYLGGRGVEIMSNSDNVLRGGLTTKHIDVDELMKHVVCESIDPQILKGDRNNNETNFPVPVDDFFLSRIQLEGGEKYKSKAEKDQILILTEGEVRLETKENEIRLKKGDSILVLRGMDYQLESKNGSSIFRAQ